MDELKTSKQLFKILIVDDDQDFLSLYTRFLAKEGFEVLGVGNSEEALCRFSEHKIDLVLLDIRMPAIDGCHLIDALRQRTLGVKIIVSSSYNPQIQKEMVRGATDYFDKSTGCHTLLSKLQTALSLGDAS